MRTKKMRLLSFVLALAMMLAIAPVGAFAESDIYSVTVTKASTDPNKSAVQQALEETYSGVDFDDVKKLTVTTNGVELNEKDFEFLSGIKVTVENESMGWYGSVKYGTGYSYLKNLEVLDLSDARCKDDTLPPRAFYQNDNIQQIILPESLRELKIRSVSTMGALVTIGAVAGVVGLPDSIEIIGESSLADNKNLIGTIYHLPNSLRELGSSCFDCDTNVNGEITIGTNVAIKKNIYHDKPSGAEKDSMSFFAKTSITKLSIEGDAITEIGPNFALGCKELTEVNIVSKVTEIKGAAFIACPKLKTITIPGSVTTIAADAFNDGTVLETVNFGGTEEEWNALVKGNTALSNSNINVKYVCNVTFNTAYGTAPKAQMVERGNTATEPTTPVANGLKFEGWYTKDENGKYAEEAFNFENAITSNTELYAKWSADMGTIEPANYKLTLTDCTATLDDGTEVKSDESAYVQAGKTVTLKLTASVDNMKFNGFVLDPRQDSLKYTDDTTATFTMPESPVDVTVDLQPEDTDDSWDAATIVTGVAMGAGAAVLTYHIGTELYAKQILGDGVAVPKTREDVALKAWELAGKPAVAVEGEPLSEAAQAEKWAVESGLMQNDADGSFNGQKKMSKLKALRVLDSAKKMNAQ